MIKRFEIDGLVVDLPCGRDSRGLNIVVGTSPHVETCAADPDPVETERLYFYPCCQGVLDWAGMASPTADTPVWDGGATIFKLDGRRAESRSDEIRATFHATLAEFDLALVRTPDGRLRPAETEPMHGMFVLHNDDEVTLLLTEDRLLAGRQLLGECRTYCDFTSVLDETDGPGARPVVTFGGLRCPNLCRSMRIDRERMSGPAWLADVTRTLRALDRFLFRDQP
ncbi:hypothetical protein [Litorisediminicola beolgyonensis]|uniref:hypothetical protein n=1 Tax=Litorisediminicola beolgyonensis TaxID=1173614 RepID=UPI0036D9E191